MSTFPNFMNFPPEIRLMIWREALDGRVRVIKLNAQVKTAVFSDVETSHKERVVFGGRFMSTSFPEEQKDLVWPPESETLVQNIGLACLEARQVVLEEYPDLLRAEEPEPRLLETPPLEAKRWTGSFLTLNNDAPMHRTVRCNLQSDYVCFDQFEDGCHDCRDGKDFAKAIHSTVTMPPNRGVALDNFVSALTRIRHLIIEGPWKQRGINEVPHEDAVSHYLEHQYMNVISGACNLKTLSIYRNNIPPHMKNPTEAVWEELFKALPCPEVDISSNRAYSSIINFYKAMSHRFMASTYKTTSPSTILGIYLDVENQVSPEGNPEAFIRELCSRLNQVGLTGVRADAEQLTMVSDASSEAAKRNGVLVMPKIAIIQNEWPLYPMDIYF